LLGQEVIAIDETEKEIEEKKGMIGIVEMIDDLMIVKM
jgi:hypothetical protein